MKERTSQFVNDFFRRHEDLIPLREDILQAGQMLIEAFEGGNQVLMCGNGGSCADCDHIAGEFLKGFLLKRPVPQDIQKVFEEKYGAEGAGIAGKLQQGLPAISLNTHSAAISAFANDVDPELVYAQQVLAYGKPGDVLIGISTSGNAANVAAAVMTANSIGVHTIGLTGKDGGKLAKLADLALIMPQMETYRIQEDHLAVYHLLCAMAEYELFDM
ncbi:MAG: SIS domain-containing protein [Oscillospiraceae bacterium]|nr:SIS domain-containing protein [Oscillospiraceae bacterium]